MKEKVRNRERNVIKGTMMKKSNECLSQLWPQLHLRTLQGIINASKSVPVDPIGISLMRSTKILSVEIGSMTTVIPPSAFKSHCTRTGFLIFGGKLHSTMK